MIKISYKSEIQNFNPSAQTCMVILYGLMLQKGEEIGRFVLDKKLLSGKEYDLYVNEANQSIDENFLKKWEHETVAPLKDLIQQFEKDSNKEQEPVKEK